MNYDLTQLLEALKTDVINSLQANGKDTSGKATKEISITTDNCCAQLQLPGYMKLLETGRAPTGKNAVPGVLPMIQRIQQWCKEKGIPDKAAWAIKKSIDKKGFKGIPGLLTEPLSDENINLRLNPAMEAIASAVCAEISGLIN